MARNRRKATVKKRNAAILFIRLDPEFFLGKCEGLITLLRGTPFNANKRRVYLPTNLLMERNLSSQNVRNFIIIVYS